MVLCTVNEYNIIRADCRNVFFVKSAVGHSAVKIERKSVEKGSSYILICNRVFKNCGPEWPFLPLVIINSVGRAERLYCTLQQIGSRTQLRVAPKSYHTNSILQKKNLDNRFKKLLKYTILHLYFWQNQFNTTKISRWQLQLAAWIYNITIF